MSTVQAAILALIDLVIGFSQTAFAIIAVLRTLTLPDIAEGERIAYSSHCDFGLILSPIRTTTAPKPIPAREAQYDPALHTTQARKAFQ